MSLEVIRAEIDYIRSIAINPEKPDLFDFFGLKLKMLEERQALFSGVSGKNNFQTSATKQYLLACVFRHPGLSRQELKELAGIPGSPRRSETDVFRDYLHALRGDIYIDEHGKCWPRNGLELPVARIGTVVLDGRVTETMKKALVFLRDNPGATEAVLHKALRIKDAAARRRLRVSLRDKVDIGQNGQMFVKGYIPPSISVTMPAKTFVSIEDQTLAAIMDHMEFKVLYDWSELVGVYRELGFSSKDGYEHLSRMVSKGLIGTKQRKFYRVHS